MATYGLSLTTAAAQSVTITSNADTTSTIYTVPTGRYAMIMTSAISFQTSNTGGQGARTATIRIKDPSGTDTNTLLTLVSVQGSTVYNFISSADASLTIQIFPIYIGAGTIVEMNVNAAGGGGTRTIIGNINIAEFE
jgi:hypothetical protein